MLDGKIRSVRYEYYVHDHITHHARSGCNAAPEPSAPTVPSQSPHMNIPPHSPSANPAHRQSHGAPGKTRRERRTRGQVLASQSMNSSPPRTATLSCGEPTRRASIDADVSSDVPYRRLQRPWRGGPVDPAQRVNRAHQEQAIGGSIPDLPHGQSAPSRTGSRAWKPSRTRGNGCSSIRHSWSIAW